MTQAPPRAARRRKMLTRKQDNERTDARDKQRQAEDVKIAKLKALRLAKEAADKVARDAAPVSQTQQRAQPLSRAAASPRARPR